MSCFKKALSVFLCFIIVFGSASVGTEGFTELLDILSVESFAIDGYEIRFIEDDYELVVVDILEGEEIVPPADPEKEGYSFVGWFDNDGKTPLEYGTMPNKNLVFYAEWVANTYTVTWISNGEIIDQSVYEYNSEICSITVPKWDGHTFLDWYPSVPEKMPANDLVFTAQWSDIEIPDDAVVFRNNSYKVFDDSMTWQEAKEYCESIGGHLATITTQEEQSFIEDLIKDCPKNCYWLGAQKNSLRAFDFWITGEDFTYSNWKTGEPNDEKKKENYLEIYCKARNNQMSPGQWNDITENGKNGNGDLSFYSLNSVGFICEWDFASRNAPYWGDLNGDGIVNFKDILIYNKIRLGKIMPTQEQRCFMDVNLNGEISDVVDAQSISDEDKQDLVEMESLNDQIPQDMLYMNMLRLARIDSLPAENLANYEFVLPTKTTYSVGEAFDRSGMRIIVTNKYNPSVRYELTDNIGVKGFDSTSEGYKKVTMTFHGMKKQFIIIVGDVSLEETITGTLDNYEIVYDIPTKKPAYISPVIIDAVEIEVLENLITTISEAQCYVGRRVKATLYDGVIVSIELADKNTVDETEYTYDGFTDYGIEDKTESKELLIQEAAVEFVDTMQNYFETLGKGVGNFETVNYEKIAKQLKKDGQEYFSFNGDLTEGCSNAVYYALAHFITDVADQNQLNIKINYNKTPMENAISITNSVFTSFTGSGIYYYYKNGYHITIDALVMGNAFSGQITVENTNVGNTYIGLLVSGEENTKNMLYAYINNLGNIVKDGCKYALASIVHEFFDVVGISQSTDEALNKFFTDKTQILFDKGYGDVLKFFKEINIGYNITKGIRDEISGNDLDTAVSNFSQHYFDVIKSLDFSEEGVKKWAVKTAIGKVKKAQHKLEDALYNYIYDVDTGDPDFEKIFKRVSVKCPVDVELYDKIGNLIGYVDSSDKYPEYVFYVNDIYIDVDGNAKYIYYPSDMDITVVLRATDYGEMEYSIEDFGEFGPKGRINYYRVPLTVGEEYTQTIPANADLEQLKDELVLDNGKKKIKADDYYSSQDTNAHITVECISSMGGVALGKGDYPIGSVVKMIAVPDGEGNVFSGWFINDKCVSRDVIYQFVAKDNIKLVAKFEKRTAQPNIAPFYNPTYNSKILVKSDEVYKNSKVTVIAKATNVPKEYVLAIYDGEKEPEVIGDNTLVKYEMPKEISNTKTLTVKVIDKDGNIQKDANGKDLSENIEIKVKSGFFNLIIAFFKKLFRANKVTIEP